MTVILYAIPGFFLLMAIELGADIYRKTGYYRLNDAIASLSIGMLSRVATIIKTLIPLSIYGLVVNDIAIIDWPKGEGFFILAFVLYDFLYYWNHRLGHERSILWAAHVVHHSSEEYNLTTALRQTSGSIINWIFFIPLALLGVPLESMVTIAALNLVYQFWVHTRHVNRLGILDRLIVTPSNHRVHHAQNDRYLDKNYGGVFIIWDRMFNTFEPEDDNEPPVYGIRTPVHSWNPVWSNWHIYKQLFSDSIKTSDWGDKFKVWLGRTGWRPNDVIANSVKPELFNPETFVKFDIHLSLQQQVYALLQLALGLVLTLGLLIQFTTFSLEEKLIGCMTLVVVLLSLGWFIETTRRANQIEAFKWVCVLGSALIIPFADWVEVAIVAIAISSGLWCTLYKLSLMSDNTSR